MNFQKDSFPAREAARQGSVRECKLCLFSNPRLGRSPKPPTKNNRAATPANGCKTIHLSASNHDSQTATGPASSGLPTAVQ